MSRVLDEFPEGSRKKNSYDWSRWNDGRVHLLVRGEDYLIEDASMKTNAYMYARRHGFTVRTSVHDDGIIVQFTPDKTSNLWARATDQKPGLAQLLEGGH